jgi:hypothetical protein
MTDIDYDALAKAMLTQAVSQKAAGSTPSGVNAHGTGGLFSSMGLSRPLFSAMVLPQVGLQSVLPVRYSNETNPLYGLITGVTASTGSNPTGVCDDPPYAGSMKLCTHSFVFSRLSRRTRVFDIESAGQTINRGEFTDLQVFGGIKPGSPNAPTIPFGNGDMTNAAAATAFKAMFEFGVSWIRDFARQIYTGNPTNNTAGGGYKEFYGLDTLINTGYRDAETGVACPAADSLVYSFANADVKTNSASIVSYVTSIYRNLNFIASRANMNPVKWALSGSFGLFYALTEVWPIAYATYRDAGLIPTGATQFVDSSDIMKLREDMRGDLYERNGQYLLIDGQRVPFIIDDAIEETQSTVSFISDLYFVPMTVLGGQPVTFLEYFNYDAPGAAMEMAKTFAPTDSFFTTDGGRFLFHKKPPTNTCVEVVAYTRPRLMLLTPYLAARLTDIKYTPLQHERQWGPTDPYFVNGGRTAGDVTAPSYYTPTA